MNHHRKGFAGFLLIIVNCLVEVWFVSLREQLLENIEFLLY